MFANNQLITRNMWDDGFDMVNNKNLRPSHKEITVKKSLLYN